MESSKKPQKTKKRAGKLFGILFLLVVIIVAVLLILGWRKGMIFNTPSIDGQLSERQVTYILNKLDNNILVPDDEQPLIATITDADLLKQSQPFYQDAENGHYLIIFPSISRAMIFDAQKGILINVGPLQIQEDVAANTPQAVPPASVESQVDAADTQEPLTIEVRNGSGVSGQAGTLASQLELSDQYSVTSTGDASRSDYEASVVVDLSGGAQSARAAQLASDLGVAVVTELPEGEFSSESDVVVIIGQ